MKPSRGATVQRCRGGLGIATQVDQNAHPLDNAHTFHALAFVENFSLRDLALRYPEAKRTHHRLWFPAPSGGTVFMFPAGAVVFYDMGQSAREAEL